MRIAAFRLGRYEDAMSAARLAVQVGPNFSYSHLVLAACFARLDRIDEAKEAAARVLECQPDFTIGGFDLPTEEVRATFVPALRMAGLPECHISAS